MDTHRFIGFEVRMSKYEMKRLGYQNLEYVTEKTANDTVVKEKDAA